MIKLLLDTHIFLWFISGDSHLPVAVGDAIRNPDDDVYLSVVSIWEAIIKYRICKLPLPHPPGVYLSEQRERHKIASLGLDEESVAALAKLPPVHRDPFDRMLICQATRHGLTIATMDPAIRAYPVSVT